MILYWQNISIDFVDLDFGPRKIIFALPQEPILGCMGYGRVGGLDRPPEVLQSHISQAERAAAMPLLRDRDVRRIPPF
jgi:hypothetical protein